MRSALAAVALLGCLGGAGCLAAPAAIFESDAEALEWPEPVSWGQPAPRASVALALREALARSKWQVEADTGQSLTARHAAEQRVLRIRLDYTPQQVRYHYVDSQNYLYRHEDGQGRIHRRANRLLARLDRAVRTELRRLRLEESDAMEVVPMLPAEPGQSDPES